ncbi:hypothetical protein [Mycolicibacterium llatzerense]|uniref:hypothetical protein n=1 Tax=Mycolicibacterium llatzerense TaxID=280871 RepID=UPI0021B5914C|nr:hypothetical protein [Mycolicibacterium llatzerense]MCT7373203.1 hypothetical protein [Mycolicibacterium llatzerense]
MIDTRFQLVLDDIDAAIASRKAADAAIDDARTRLADMAEEGFPSGFMDLIKCAASDIDASIRFREAGWPTGSSRLLDSARATVKRALEIG